MPGKKLVTALALSLGAIAAAAQTAHGQACIGTPIGSRQFGLGGSIGFTDGATSYGVALRANLEGPLSVGVGYGLTDVDNVEEKVNNFQGSVAYELPLQGISACPVTGLGYSRISGEDAEFDAEATATNLSIPVGFGVGQTFAAGPSLSVTLFAIPQFVYSRSKGEISLGGMTVEETETSSEFAASLGITLGTSRLYFGGEVFLTTLDEADPVFSLGLGLIFP